MESNNTDENKDVRCVIISNWSHLFVVSQRFQTNQNDEEKKESDKHQLSAV